MANLSSCPAEQHTHTNSNIHNFHPPRKVKNWIDLFRLVHHVDNLRAVYLLCGETCKNSAASGPPENMINGLTASNLQSPHCFHPRPINVLWATKCKDLEIVTLPSVNPKRNSTSCLLSARIKGNYPLGQMCCGDTITKQSTCIHKYTNANVSSSGVLVKLGWDVFG